jgi:hypothetical protein
MADIIASLANILPQIPLLHVDWIFCVGQVMLMRNKEMKAALEACE